MESNNNKTESHFTVSGLPYPAPGLVMLTQLGLFILGSGFSSARIPGSRQVADQDSARSWSFAGILFQRIIHRLAFLQTRTGNWRLMASISAN
jgi:hypothetical protein